MLENNYTMPIEFLLVGFTDYLPLRVALFLVFLIVYTLTVVGNVGLIILVNFNSSLQTPMYYFLSNLSFLDISYSAAITPKMLVNFLASKKSISLSGCALQMFSLVALLMLNALSWQQWPTASMQPSAIHCSILLLCLGVSVSAVLCWPASVGVWLQRSTSVSHSGCHFVVPTSSAIFSCDIPPLLALSCTGTCINELLLFALCGFIQTITSVVIFISYFCILLTVLSIKSSGRRSKTFSTCASHLIAITLFYGALLVMYLPPTTSYSPDTDKVLAVFYTVVFPMFNPIIYSFRNKGVKYALRKPLDRNWAFRTIGIEII